MLYFPKCLKMASKVKFLSKVLPIIFNPYPAGSDKPLPPV